MTPTDDLTGYTFSHWTVIGPAQSDPSGRKKWLCRCSCGTERIVDGYALRNGKTVSCGHTRFVSRSDDISGQRFGMLVALERVRRDSTSHRSVWRCRCDCGNEALISHGNLKSGHTTSCGCAAEKARQSPDARIEALKKSPLTGAFETNIRAKCFVISDGTHWWEIKNLSKFVRDNAELLGADPNDNADMERVAKALYSASYAHCKWHGWSVEQVPEHKRKGTVKICQACGAEYLSWGGSSKYCRACAEARNRESIRKGVHAYYQQHKDEICARNRQRYRDDPDRRKELNRKYYEAHTDEIKERARLNSQGQDHRAYQAEYYAKNKERIKAQRKAKRELDKQKESTD